jgi:ubiquinone/menaquinone biosynthesis C-methylase UbiE
MTPAAAFDRVAARYDELWTDTAVGSAQRRLVWRNFGFHSGERVLDLGCGTGADAVFLSGRGVDVHATDCSPAMVEEARRRGGFRASVLRAEAVGELEETFDGAISNFGALNCVADLPAVARGLAKVVRPGGRVVICTIGRFCMWETLYYVGCSRAVRRWRGHASSASLAIDVHYPTVAEMKSAFAPEFTLVRWMGIGLLVPPSYVRLPAALVRVFERIDGVMAHVQGLRALADHRLLILVRK